jgi:alkanesulfonate monooxygenase SsuD/methylene tetrahydromethanopterin reductase-like flavin-dependent oxidoreductase (luciferase family)
MFSVNAAAAEAIRRAFEEGGETPAVLVLRRYFPGITDDAAAKLCARTIAGWKPFPLIRKTRMCRVSLTSM